MLPCPMFSSQSSQPSSPSPGSSSREFSASPFNSCSLLPFDFSTFEPYNLQTIPFVSPFSATLTGHPELHENKTTLSLAVVTLTNPVTHNPFACHSCKKHPGVRIPSGCHPERSEGSAFPDGNTRTYDSKLPWCHPDRSGPVFSRAPFCGAPGRAVEGSWQPVNPTPTAPTSNLPLASLEVTNPSVQLSTLNFQLSFLSLKADNLKLITAP
jgi:hypothetical protein